MYDIHPKNWPILTESDKKRILDCFESGRLWSGNGHFVSDLEKEFSEWLGVKHCIAVTNGTHALEIALAAAEIGLGDEVLVPAFTFMSSASAVLMRNAIPIPVDVDPNTFCIDTKKLREVVNANTKAIMPVHISGNACDMDAVLELAHQHSLSIIEDCAHSLGAQYENGKSRADRRQMLGSLGHCGCFSFQASKLVVGGEGGMFATNDTSLYERALSFSNYGWVPNGIPYGHFMLGSNYRMPELIAALVIGQIPRVTRQSSQRHLNVIRFEKALGEFSTVKFQTRRNTRDHSHFFFVIVVNGLGSERRDLLVDRLVSKGIPARRNYPAFHRTSLFQNIKETCPDFMKAGLKLDYSRFSTPVADDIANNGFWLPHWLFLDDDIRLEELLGVLRDFDIS